jgi:hypothetical protein
MKAVIASGPRPFGDKHLQMLNGKMPFLHFLLIANIRRIRSNLVFQWKSHMQ